jgi:hypothetical protein
MAEEITDKAPRTIPAKGRNPKPPEKVVEPEAPEPEAAILVVEDAPVSDHTTTREILSEGEKFQVEFVVSDEGSEIVKESVYRTVQLPNSNRTTKILIKAKGTRLFG